MDSNVGRGTDYADCLTYDSQSLHANAGMGQDHFLPIYSSPAFLPLDSVYSEVLTSWSMNRVRTTRFATLEGSNSNVTFKVLQGSPGTTLAQLI
jgi:hypothetical protein